MEKKLSYEKKIISQIIEQLPKTDSFQQNFHYSFTNWLPFYWRGYEQTTRYTYVIEDLSDLNNVFNSFSYSKKKNIKKAEKILEIKFNLSAKFFFDNHKMTLSKQKKNISYGYELFENIYENGYKNKSAITIYAEDSNGNIHGALFVIWDENSAYSLISTIDPDYRNSGSGSLLVREIIKFLSTRTRKFDFEGSMIENVENSFRQFGAIQKPYFQIKKINSKLYKTLKIIKPIIK